MQTVQWQQSQLDRQMTLHPKTSWVDHSLNQSQAKSVLLPGKGFQLHMEERNKQKQKTEPQRKIGAR